MQLLLYTVSCYVCNNVSNISLIQTCYICTIASDILLHVIIFCIQCVIQRVLVLESQHEEANSFSIRSLFVGEERKGLAIVWVQ